MSIDSINNKQTIEHIIIRGNPYQRGYSYGNQLKTKIVQNFQYYRQRYELLEWTQVYQFINDNYVKALQKYYPSGLQQMKGIADGCGLSVDDIIALNSRYELMRWNRQLIRESCKTLSSKTTPKPDDTAYYVSHECTSAVCLPKATKSGDVLMGQNWENNKRMLRDDMIVLLEVYPDPDDNVVPFFTLTEPGTLGRSGMNANGLGVTGMSLMSSEDFYGQNGRNGYLPISLLRQLFLESPTFTVGLQRVLTAPRHVSVNITVATGEGQAFNIEMTPKHNFISDPNFQTDIITHSNAFKSDSFLANSTVTDIDTSIIGPSLVHDNQMQRQLLKHLGHIDDQTFQDAFKNHLGYPDSLCSHVPDPGNEYLSTTPNMCTIANIVMNLTTKKLTICRGQPCCGVFQEYSFK